MLLLAQEGLFSSWDPWQLGCSTFSLMWSRGGQHSLYYLYLSLLAIISLVFDLHKIIHTPLCGNHKIEELRYNREKVTVLHNLTSMWLQSYLQIANTPTLTDFHVALLFLDCSLVHIGYLECAKDWEYEQNVLVLIL